MKATDHVEYLLRQGKKPKELLALGFSKSIVTRVRKRLKEEKAAARTKAPKGRAEAKSLPQPSMTSPTEMEPIQQKLAYLESEIQKVENLAKGLPEVAALVIGAREFGTLKREECPYQEDGLCTLWAWTSQDAIPSGAGEPVLVEKEEPPWHIKPAALYCAMCNEPFESRIGKVENRVSANPLSRARYEFICEGCGSKGWIATHIKCTECGRETWWGWWPER